MNTLHRLSTATLSILAVTMTSPAAWAIPLPDTSSTCDVRGADGCLRIANINTDGGSAIVGTSSGNGIAVRGIGQERGNGVQGETNSGFGVLGTSETGRGVVGDVGQTSGPLAAGVEGRCFGRNGAGVVGRNNSDGSGFGVKGESIGGGSGAAVFGDADNSFVTWAGLFEGYISARDVFADGQVFAAGVQVTSDLRLKNDVKSFPDGLAQLLRLRPVTYKWKDASSDQTSQMGLIAQEVQKIVPEAVATNDRTGMLSINYSSLLPLMINALQEQQRVIQEQGARVADLERKAGSDMVSSLAKVSAGAGTVVALGLLPVGLIAARRRRKRSDT